MWVEAKAPGPATMTKFGSTLVQTLIQRDNTESRIFRMRENKTEQSSTSPIYFKTLQEYVDSSPDY